VQTLTLVTLAVGYHQTVLHPVTTWNEKAYEKFLRDLIEGLFLLRGAANPIIRVQTANGYALSGSSVTVTLTTAPINGNILVLTYTYGGSAMAAISGITQAGVTWNSTYTAQCSYSPSLSQIWLATANTSASTSITVVLSAAVGTNGEAAIVNVCEYSGLTQTVDKTVYNSNEYGTPTSTGSFTTLNANDLLVGSISLFCQNGSTAGQSAPTNSFTLIDGANHNTTGQAHAVSNAYLENIVSATGSYSTGTTFSSSANAPYWTCCLIALEAAMISYLTVNDSGRGTEALSPVNQPQLNDSATGTELPGSGFSLTISETGAFTENDVRMTGVLPYYSLAALEVGQATEVITTVTATTVSASDSGVGTDVPSVTITVEIDEYWGQ
jgi:hypothetical protein